MVFDTYQACPQCTLPILQRGVGHILYGTFRTAYLALRSLGYFVAIPPPTEILVIQYQELTGVFSVTPFAHWTRAVVSALGEVIYDGVIHPEEKEKCQELTGVFSVTPFQVPFQLEYRCHLC